MKKIITHASLFSGIGAPELAATWLGWKNLFHCEINEFCNSVLNYWFPDSIGYENIKTTDFTEWQGKVDVLTGGFPCQPFSSAGQRRGANDDRYLWPEMLRAIREIQPSFVIGENVAGILSMVQPGKTFKMGGQMSLFGESNDIYRKEQQFVTETVCSDLEREKYSIQPFVIPACSVGAPHKRDRVWFIARRNVPPPSFDALHHGTLREPVINESKGKTKRIQEWNKIQQFIESDSIFRYTANPSNSRTEDLREWPTKVLPQRTITHPIGGGNSTQQESTGTQRERWSDYGKQSERRIPTERTDGLRQFSFSPAKTRYSSLQEREHELAAYSNGKRWQQEFYENGKFESTQEAKCRTKQFGRTDCPQDWWRNFPSVPPVCNGNDGLPFDISRITIPFCHWRVESLKSLGNSMVPQVVFELFKAIEKEIKKQPDC